MALGVGLKALGCLQKFHSWTATCHYSETTDINSMIMG